MDFFHCSGIDLIDYDNISPAQIDLPWEIGRFIAVAQGVHYGYLKIRAKKREVVIPSVPDDDIPFPFRGPENPLIIYAGVDHGSLADERLILLPFLDGAVIEGEVLEMLETFDRLFC